MRHSNTTSGVTQNKVFVMYVEGDSATVQKAGIRCTRSVLHGADVTPHSLTHATTRQSSNVGRANS